MYRDNPSKPRLTAADFHPEVLALFDRYVHGGLDRRGFLDKAARFAALGGTTTAGLLAALSPDFARAQKVPPSDARIKTDRVEIPPPQATAGSTRWLLAPRDRRARCPPCS